MPNATRDAPTPCTATGRDLLRAVLAPDPAAAVLRLVDDGALPEVAALDMPDRRGRHKDVLDHSLKVMAKTPDRPVVRLAGLLHDVGKPDTRAFGPGGVTFVNHELVGGRITRRMLRRLGFDATTTARVATVVALSGRFKEGGGTAAEVWTDSAVRRLAGDAGEALGDLLDLCEVDCTSRYPDRHERQRREVRALRDRMARVAAADARAAERPDLTGEQVMALLGIPPGPAVGEALGMLLAAKRATGGPLGQQAAEEMLAAWWRNRC